MIYDFWYMIDETLLVPAPTSGVPTKCDGCGEEIDIHNSYMLVRAFRSHMKEECLTKVYNRVKKEQGNFDLAATGAKDYGKAR